MAEDGVISYGVFEAIGDPNLSIHVEVYEDQTAFDDHVASSHVETFLIDLDASRYPDPDKHVFHVSKAEQIHID